MCESKALLNVNFNNSNSNNINELNLTLNKSSASMRKSMLDLKTPSVSNIFKSIDKNIERIEKGLLIGQNDMKAENKNNKPYECKRVKMRS